MNAAAFFHSECAGEYIEAISANMGLCSASLGYPIMGDLHSMHLIPERIETDQTKTVFACSYAHHML